MKTYNTCVCVCVLLSDRYAHFSECCKKVYSSGAHIEVAG